ncbi:3-keto-disaccharide hydrolase [Pedobacter sp. PWIIR3]
MKQYIFSALIIGSMMSSSFSKAQSGASKGFTKLFDGKSTSGWHTYGKTAASTKWKADAGTLHFVPSSEGDGGDLVTDKAYSNFHLKIDWKVAPKSNSGIIFYVQDDPQKYGATYMTGPEMQVLDNDGHPDGKITKHRAGNLYDLIQSSSEPVKPVGEWNTAEIIANKGSLELKLNGISVVKTTLWDQNWKELVAKSKFAAWEGFGAFKSGKIALQDHGDEVWYKNIMIKEL